MGFIFSTMRKIFFLLAFLSFSIAHAQQVRPATSTKIYSELSELKHLTCVLYVAAHPDDENTRLLAWLVNDKHIRTAYLSLTRGDGGQNILGSEQGPALGFIRTHELMEARKLDGAEQYFARAIDFGFSKNSTETFKHWNEYLLTSDVCWAIRKLRPDVVICRFPPTAQAGHGQHAVSAIVAADAFKVCGNKLQFTEQLKYYPAWQPKRLLFNAFRFGSFNTTTEDMLKLQVGQYIPSMGMGAGELAGISRSVHKSQGAGTPSVPGTQTEYFKLVSGDSMSKSIFDGIDITWGRVNRKDIGEDIQAALDDYDYMHPDASLPALLNIRKKIQAVSDEYWRKQKLEELDRIILDCSGFMAELYAKQPQSTTGENLPFTLHVIARSKMPLTLKYIQYPSGDSLMNLDISKDTMFSFDHMMHIPENTPVTEPYWLSMPSSLPDMFPLPEDSLLGLPEAPNNLNAILTLKIGDELFKVPVPLSYKKLDPTKGDVVEQLRIVPDVTLEFTNTLLVTNSDGSVHAEVRIHPLKNIPNATLSVYADKGSDKTIPNLDLHMGNDTSIEINYTAKETEQLSKGDFFLSAEIKAGGKTYSKTQKLIQYNHIPTLQYFTPAYTKVLRKNWKCTVKRIGFIEGAGDYTVTFLRLAGLDVDILKDADMANAEKLKKYDAIVTGVRAVNVEKKMATWLPVLFKYAENGGTLIIQYNTLQDLSTTKIGPYPFTLSNDRVTEEDAKVTFLDPKNKLLNYPNKITDADFSDWVQERGLYFPTKYDSTKYQTILRMNDTGEKPSDGSTLYAKVGKGNYIYTSLSFFRQLPAGNKGAIRLFMNMLSVGK